MSGTELLWKWTMDTALEETNHASYRQILCQSIELDSPLSNLSADPGDPFEVLTRVPLTIPN